MIFETKKELEKMIEKSNHPHRKIEASPSINYLNSVLYRIMI